MTEIPQPTTESTDVKMLINDQYFIFKKIGQGGFGAVWRSYDFSLRNFVAIKELLPEFSDLKYVEMFYKEALIAKNLIHDNIVRVQHFWKGSNGSYYLLMDFVRGNDLEHIIKRCNSLQTRLPWEHSILICSNILKALDYASRLAKDSITGKPYGIVYRDISPGNIIVSFEGNVKLSDFGIAKTAEELDGGIKQRIVTGKYAYMSPEQVKGDTDIDPRSDIYSVGVVLYEMLTGLRLFEGSNEEIKNKVIEKKFDVSLLANLNLPEELIEVVVKSLEKDRALRYEKAIEMFRDLRRLLKGKETEELTVDLSDFVTSILTTEQEGESRITEYVKKLNLQEIKGDPSVIKVMCRDFIVGNDDHENPKVLTVETTVPAARPAGPPIFIKDVPRPPVPARSLPVLTPSIEQPLVKQPPISSVSADVSPEVQVPRQVRSSSSFPGERIQSNEEKGKTVFEEVGDWLVTRFKLYRRRVIRVTVAFIFAILLFALIDTFIRITPFGRMMYSRLYPPDVIITTVPAGSSVTMKTRDGKVVLSNESSSSPIALRGIAPKTYIITAVKDGFRPVERIVKIEEPDKDTKVRAQQNIEICFDFMLAINSNPGGADIYVDGNKLSVTPWEGQLASGEHTIKLSYPGYIDLGSVAKETKDGQCNIDLTRATMLEMFSGVDQKSWKYSILNSSGVTGYALHAIMAKRINFNSNPIGMMVQLPNETAPRGQTPISIPLTGGDYAVKFFDSANRYAEQTRTVVVSTMSADTVSATLDKWITFSVSARENPHQSFDAKVRIAGKGISLEKELTTGKPLRVALPLETYKVTFFGDYQFKPLTLNSVNIEDRSSVSGQLEYSNPLLRLVAKNDNSGDPVADAYVWMNGDMIGKTSRQGLFEGNVVYGTATVRVVAKGYSENTQEKYLAPGKSYSMTYRLAPEQTVAVSSGTAARPTEEVLPEGPPKKKNIFPETRKPAVIIPTVVETTGTITCANCGKVYPAGQKKLRFCTNCGKPFR